MSYNYDCLDQKTEKFVKRDAMFLNRKLITQPAKIWTWTFNHSAILSAYVCSWDNLVIVFMIRKTWVQVGYKKIILRIKRLQNQPEPKTQDSYLKSQMYFELPRSRETILLLWIKTLFKKVLISYWEFHTCMYFD